MAFRSAHCTLMCQVKIGKPTAACMPLFPGSMTLRYQPLDNQPYTFFDIKARTQVGAGRTDHKSQALALSQAVWKLAAWEGLQPSFGQGGSWWLQAGLSKL